MDVVLEQGLLFHIASESKPGLWHNVDLNNQFCDCDALSSSCKHIIGLRLIIKAHFPHLCDEQNDPIIENDEEIDEDVDEMMEQLSSPPTLEPSTLPTNDDVDASEEYKIELFFQKIEDLEEELVKFKDNMMWSGIGEVEHKTLIIRKCL